MMAFDLPARAQTALARFTIGIVVPCLDRISDRATPSNQVIPGSFNVGPAAFGVAAFGVASGGLLDGLIMAVRL